MKSMILLCICTVLVLRLETSAARLSVQEPHHHPIYKYSCNEDLSVTFKGVNGIIEYFPVNTMNASCDIKPVPNHEGNFKISKECLSTQNFSLERTMQIAVYDQNEEENIPTTPAPTTTAPTTAPTQNPPPKQNLTSKQQPSPTPTQQPSPTKAPTQKPSPTTAPATTPSLISGGHHIFEITCLPLETEGVERIALAETGITDIEQLHNVYNEIGQVEMRFKEGESLDKPDQSEVYIGDRFYMYLKYMGDTTQYIIMPQLCTAYKGR